MDFKDSFKQLAERVATLKDKIQTEEATKNALIMPFIQMLGYDVFNPLEVVPEMDCDLIKKKGEKIDYAIIKDGEPIMLVECKHWQQDLSLHDTQLQKYFVASKAKFGVLTNGIKYRFYTDLSKSNIMDETPFLELDIENIKDQLVEEVKKFHKSYFDVDNILNSASELKYVSELRCVITNEFANPSPELVKLLAKQVYDGIITPRVLELFTDLVRRTFANHINDVISDRLKIAINNTESRVAVEKPEVDDVDVQNKEPKVNTTTCEIEAFYLIKSILRDVIQSDRITYRDAQSYFAVFIDDNNRKPVCRLYFNNESNRQVAIVDENKKEIRYKIDAIDDIYNHSDELKSTVARFNQ